MSYKYIIHRSFHTSLLRFAKSSDVVTSKTKQHIFQRQKLKPNIPIFETLRQWSHIVLNAEENLQLKQDALMKIAMPGYYNSQLGELKASNNKVPIDSLGNYLNEIKIENGKASPSETVDKTNNLVMIHGYAASLGLFYKNFHDLIKDQPNSRIFALDLLGFGLSSKTDLDFSSNEEIGTREFDIEFELDNLEHAKHVHSSLKLPPNFKIATSDLQNYNIENQLKVITKVENYYIDSLENWRIQNKLENFTLLGHSLGGYLSIAYALKYPHRVAKLVLVSPGGIERSPFAITNPILKSGKDNTEDKIVLKPSMSPESYNFLGRYPLLSKYYKKLWAYQISPFRLLRLLGPLSYNMLYSNLFKKFARDLSNFENVQEIKLVIDYTYNSVMLKSNLEYLIMKIFASSVVGKYPMFDRIQDLKIKKTLWMFGEFDFMFNSIGDISSKKMNKHGIDADFKIIPKSGHNLFLDNWKDHNKELKKFLNW